MARPVADRIRAFAAEASAPARLPPGGTRLVAVGWATVELERGMDELAGSLDVPGTAFIEAAGSSALGARCRVVAPSILDGLRVAVLEPAAEGRLAAALARWDEGPLVAWYAGAAFPEGSGTVLAGPFGPERLVGGDPLTGPHRLLVVGGPGTIAA